MPTKSTILILVHALLFTLQVIGAQPVRVAVAQVAESTALQTQASLADDYEVLPVHRCTVSTWFNGQRSSLALDPAGNPRFAYDAQHWWYGTEVVGGVPKPCNYQDVTVTRLSILTQP